MNRPSRRQNTPASYASASRPSLPFIPQSTKPTPPASTSFNAAAPLSFVAVNGSDNAERDRRPPIPVVETTSTQSATQASTESNVALEDGASGSQLVPWSREAQAWGKSADDSLDVDRFLASLSLKEAERELDRTKLPGGDGVSILQYLKEPGEGVSKSQAVRNVWTLLSEEAEKSGLATMYSVKFAEEHKLWQDCLDPRVRSVAGLHRLLGDGTILSSVSLLTGVESMRNRMKAADLIETYWGADWFSAMPDSMKSDTWDCATAMPRSVLEEIRDNAKQGIPRHEAFAKWAEVIALRSDYGKRTELGIKGPAGPTLVYTDAAWLNPDKGKKRKGKVAGQALLKSKLPTHSAFSILGPTVASKPDSTQPQATITLKRKRDATDAVAARSRRRLDASDKAGEGPGDDTEEWRLEADGVTVRRRVKNQLQRRLLEPGEELPKRAEAEDYEEEEEEEEEEDVEEDVEEEDGEEGDGKKGDGEKRDGAEKDGEERDGKERNGREEDHSGRNTNEKEGDTDEPIVVSATTRTLNGQGFNAEANLMDLVEEEKRDEELEGSSERGHVANSRCERLDCRGPDFARMTASQPIESTQLHMTYGQAAMRRRYYCETCGTALAEVMAIVEKEILPRLKKLRSLDEHPVRDISDRSRITAISPTPTASTRRGRRRAQPLNRQTALRSKQGLRVKKVVLDSSDVESREEEEEVSLDANQGILDATSVSEKDKGLSSGVRKEVEAGAERAEEESGG